MHILIAPNAYKNSLNAEEVAFAIRDGLLKSNLKFTCECFPVGDGGDGTDDLLLKKYEGIQITTNVRDPLGRNIAATFGMMDAGKTAVIGMAKASGLGLLKPGELNPLQAISFGTGQQLIAAMDKGARKLIIGIGGSATVDGGSGILRALGIRFKDNEGQDLLSLPESLDRLATIDVSGLDKRILSCEIIVLCDVENILSGNEGAASVFGPQKGASPAAVIKLEAALKQFATVTLKQTGRDISAVKYGGAAGGAAAGLYAFLNATLVNGINHFLALTGFDKALEKADLVITGEGSIDAQTLQGKGPLGVARKAVLKGIPVIALAGKVPLIKNMELQKYFDVLMAIGNEPSGMSAAVASTRDNVIRASWETGNLLSLANKINI